MTGIGATATSSVVAGIVRFQAVAKRALTTDMRRKAAIRSACHERRLRAKPFRSIHALTLASLPAVEPTPSNLEGSKARRYNTVTLTKVLRYLHLRQLRPEPMTAKDAAYLVMRKARAQRG